MNNLPSIFKHLNLFYLEKHPHKAARFLESQSLEEVKGLLGFLKTEKLSAIFGALNPYWSYEVLQSFPSSNTVAILEGLKPELAAKLLRIFSPSAREKLLKKLNPKKSKVLTQLMSYPSQSAGALMDPEFLELAEDLSVGEALSFIKAYPKKDLFLLYVVNREGIYHGKIFFGDLIDADPAWSLAKIMKPADPYLRAYSEEAQILSHWAWQEFPEIPVVDSEKRLLGILPYKKIKSLEKQRQETWKTPMSLIMELGENSWQGLGLVWNQLGQSLQRQTRTKTQERGEA